MQRRLSHVAAVLCAILGLAGPVRASDWTADDTKWQTAYLSLHAIDHRQTLYIAKNPAYHETNPILGRRPSDSEVNRYFVATALLHTAIAHTLPKNWRRGFQAISIGVEAAYVGHNYKIGISLDF